MFDLSLFSHLPAGGGDGGCFHLNYRFDRAGRALLGFLRWVEVEEESLEASLEADGLLVAEDEASLGWLG